MNRHFLLSGLAVIAMAPSLANAESHCPGNGNRAVGTIVGAGIGALFGNAVSEHGGKSGGTIIGAIGGGVAGNLIAGSGQKCGENRYGYYDTNGQWVPNTRNADGYYDADGQWVTNANNTGGYYDSNGRWVSNGGYGTTASRPAQDGYYDSNGRWVSANRSDDGYYDANGAWVSANSGNSYGQPRSAPGYGQDAVYADRNQRGPLIDTSEQETRLDRRIRDSMDQGALDYTAGRRALRDLGDIRHLDRQYRSVDGRLNRDQQAYINSRLAQLRARLGQDSSVTRDQPRSY